MGAEVGHFYVALTISRSSRKAGSTDLLVICRPMELIRANGVP